MGGKSPTKEKIEIRTPIGGELIRLVRGYHFPKHGNSHWRFDLPDTWDESVSAHTVTRLEEAVEREGEHTIEVLRSSGFVTELGRAMWDTLAVNRVVAEAVKRKVISSTEYAHKSKQLWMKAVEVIIAANAVHIMEALQRMEKQHESSLQDLIKYLGYVGVDLVGLSLDAFEEVFYHHVHEVRHNEKDIELNFPMYNEKEVFGMLSEDKQVGEAISRLVESAELECFYVEQTKRLRGLASLARNHEGCLPIMNEIINVRSKGAETAWSEISMNQKLYGRVAWDIRDQDSNFVRAFFSKYLSDEEMESLARVLETRNTYDNYIYYRLSEKVKQKIDDLLMQVLDAPEGTSRLKEALNNYSELLELVEKLPYETLKNMLRQYVVLLRQLYDQLGGEATSLDSLLADQSGEEFPLDVPDMLRQRAES